MPRITCCIVNCNCNVRNCKLYNFPTPPRLADRWVALVEPYYPRITHVPKNQLLKVKICKHHFESKYFINNTRKRIAYPTLFTSSDITRGFPSQSLGEYIEYPY